MSWEAAPPFGLPQQRLPLGTLAGWAFFRGANLKGTSQFFSDRPWNLMESPGPFQAASQRGSFFVGIFLPTTTRPPSFDLSFSPRKPHLFSSLFPPKERKTITTLHPSRLARATHISVSFFHTSVQGKLAAPPPSPLKLPSIVT